jgi:hypothetical protein
MRGEASRLSVSTVFRCAVIGGLVLLSTPLTAKAQASPSAQNAPTLQTPDPNTKKGPSPTLPSTGESLSERLDRSGGVIRPPDSLDTGIAVPPKDSGAGSNMPVIRPPSSAGGSQSLQPK